MQNEIQDDYGLDSRGVAKQIISQSISAYRQYCKEEGGVSKAFEREGGDRELRSSTTGLSGLRQPLSSLALSI